MSDLEDRKLNEILTRNHGRLEKIKEFAGSVIFQVNDLGVFGGDMNDFDDPFWSVMEGVGSDVDKMRNLLNSIE